MKLHSLWFAMSLLVFNPSSYGDTLDHPWSFKGKYLISTSDADMVASAYVDGKLGPKEGQDALSIIDLSKPPRDYSAIEVPASNSVAGPPAVLAVDPLGEYAYIIETFTPRPDNSNPHTFKDLQLGSLLTVYNIKNKQKPRLVGKQQIKQRPDGIDISPDGQWLVINYHPTTPSFNSQPLGLYKVRDGKIIQRHFPALPDWDMEDRLISVSWHPDGETLALINESAAEVSFFNINYSNVSLTPWGNTVSVGKAPFIGRFTDDGKHFLVNNLYWGSDVSGKWNEAPNGTLVNITLDADAGQGIRHALSSQVMVRPSPEGFAVSPDGKWVVTANMERSWLPYDDARQSWFSSLSLIERDPKTGAMNVMHTLPYEGILPEAVVFDTESKSFAVTTFDYYDTQTPGGAIDFFTIVADPLNPEQKMIMQTSYRAPVSRGPHSMVRLD